jgi:fructosamine-3-kinase
VEELVQRALDPLGEGQHVLRIKQLTGGSINAAWQVSTRNGEFFLKTNPSPIPDLFEREHESLAAIHSVGVLRTPKPLGFANPDADGYPGFLLTEFLDKGPATWDFHERLGQQLAEHHQRAAAPRCGFAHDNYIGTTPQPNPWTDDWVDFYAEHRLGHQLILAEANGYRGELQALGHRLTGNLHRWLDEPEEPPTLLHGDLWHGNILCTDEGEPAVIDPACFYGRRETDIAMTQLFGGFQERFYEAYDEAWPLEDGHKDRIAIYRLYHLLNHLNLFGGTYLKSCLEILRRFA